jgi:NAD(P)-dependent dehydrogenase (short-subunit alcohol dehydrogenase family)
LVACGAACMLDRMSEQTIALVTGANKGIGYAIAAGLGALGWSVGVGARDDRRREEGVAKLIAAGVAAFGVALDVTDDASVADAARRIEERAGRLDVLINNAGVAGGWPEAPTTLTPEEVQRVVETNVQRHTDPRAGRSDRNPTRDPAGRRPDRRIVRRHWDRPLVRVSPLLRRSVSPLVPVGTIRRSRRGGLSP